MLKTVKRVLIACTFVITASNSSAQEVDCIDLEALRDGSSDLTKQGCTVETEILRLGITGRASELIDLRENGSIPDELIYLYRRQTAFLALDSVLRSEKLDLQNYADDIRSQFILSHAGSLYELRGEDIRVASFLGLTGVLEILEGWDTNRDFWITLENEEPEIQRGEGRSFFICALKNIVPSDRSLSNEFTRVMRDCISEGIYDY